MIMKRNLIILFYIFTISPALAQRNIFEYNNTIDINLGYNNSGALRTLVDKNICGVSGMQLSLCVYGVYLDAAFNVQGNSSSNMGIGKYKGYQTWACHIGYSFPVCKWAKIIPVVGMTSWAEGYYDGSDYYVTDDGVANRFKGNGYSYKAFDYGIVFNFTISEWVNLYVNIEAHNIGGGVGLSIPLIPYKLRH